MPTVSIVLPAYNAALFISGAIDSLLKQTFSDWELIVIDDCSSDATRDIIQQYAAQDTRIVALQNSKNLKICHTLNKGIALAQGKYIARMDADDYSTPERLAKQVAFLDGHPEVGIVGGTMEIIDDQGTYLGTRRYHLTDQEIRKHIFRYSPFCHPAIMIRTQVIKDAGGYDPDMVYAEDYDLYFRIGRISKFANLPNTLLLYRMYPNNHTTKKLREMEQKTRGIKKKAVTTYGYTMHRTDKVYTRLQKVSSYLMPGSVRIRLFNLMRNKQ